MDSIKQKIEPVPALLVTSFYLFMMANYYLALYIDTGVPYHFATVTLNHIIKAILTIPLWWGLFRYLATTALWKKVLIHLAVLPVFTLVWSFLYYELCDVFGLRYLQGSRQIWDYYLTALFYIIQFANFHLYDFYIRHRKERLRVSELAQLALQSELSALKAQLNPHFLYNVFNTINASLPAKSERTRNMVAKLSDLFRYQLKASKEEYVQVREEIDFVKKYLELEKERFGDRLNYQFEIADQVIGMKIPPMIVQPIVENAIKHGLSSLIDGGEITVTIKPNDDGISIEVKDTGVGLQGRSLNDILEKGVGLSNTHERLVKMFGSGLELKDVSPSGLQVAFSLPVISGI